jgi:hypothetical protein
MQWPVNIKKKNNSNNNNRGILFFAQTMLMAVHAMVEYVMPLLNDSCTAAEEQSFLRGLCRDV